MQVITIGHADEFSETTVMPNVKGMGLKDALYLLENMGLKVTVKEGGKL
ncbi:MAG: PASTA domain-containing protein [Bacteroidota bacterium]